MQNINKYYSSIQIILKTYTKMRNIALANKYYNYKN